VEFGASAGGTDYREESVPVHSPEELFAFIAPGGGSEHIPDEIDEIPAVFLRPGHPRWRPVGDRCPREPADRQGVSPRPSCTSPISGHPR